MDRDTTESLVEIHRGEEGLQKRALEELMEATVGPILAGLTFSSTTGQSMFPKRVPKRLSGLNFHYETSTLFWLFCCQNGPIQSCPHKSPWTTPALPYSCFSSLEILQPSGMHCGMTHFSFSPQTSLIEGRWHLTLSSPLGICAKSGLAQLGYNMDVIPIFQLYGSWVILQNSSCCTLPGRSEPDWNGV